MDHNLLEYDFRFLENLYQFQDYGYEHRKIANEIDKYMTKDSSVDSLLHTTHCLYSLAFLIGYSSYIYTIYTLVY